MSKFKVYATSILFPLIVGGIIGFIISGFTDYDTLQKPFLAPPGIVFPIVWAVLYVLMGISYGMLKCNCLNDSKIKLVYYLQLFFNFLWPIAFFVLKWRLFAFIWIIILTLLVLWMVIFFYSKNKTAGLLQITYLLWCIFATYLNLFIYLLN